MNTVTNGTSSSIQGFRAFLRWFMHTKCVRLLVLCVILLNSVTLGLETSPSTMAVYGNTLSAVDHWVLGFFILEISLRVIALGPLHFFRGRWNIFDFFVVAISLIPNSGELSILRTLRILRVLRLISSVPAMRRVVDSLVESFYGVMAVAAILLLTFYIFAVIATHLYADYSKEYFGSIGNSMFTLFQVMTLASWPELARDLMKTHENAWLFFVLFILITTFTIINLLVGVMVNTMQNVIHVENEHYQGVERRKRNTQPPDGRERRSPHKLQEGASSSVQPSDCGPSVQNVILAEISLLRLEIGELRKRLEET